MADDVKCSHGATISQLEKEELFYLQSRGINNSQARKLIVEAFCKEIIDSAKDIFKKVNIYKPSASRKDSKENYIICKFLK